MDYIFGKNTNAKSIYEKIKKMTTTWRYLKSKIAQDIKKHFQMQINDLREE